MGNQLSARIGVWEGSAEELERWVANVGLTLKPAVEQQPGVKGAFFFADRENGRALTVTLWASEDAREASEGFRGQSQARTAAASGSGYVRTERYEVVDSLWAGSNPEAHG